jgi:ABC-type uncharacterized transport system auxiliary subunit
MCVVIPALLALLAGCASAPVKQYYTLNYIAEPMSRRINPSPYPYTIRIKKLDIEEAYARPQIVYRKSPFEMQYYFYRVWAVKPVDMVSDLIEKHMASANIVSHVVRRLDEGAKPDYELSGKIEAIEEYDNESVWFAHFAIRLQLTRLSDDQIVYSRRFDDRKQVFQREPESVVREMSRIMDVRVSQALMDIDAVLAREYGLSANNIPLSGDSAVTPATDTSSGAGNE